MATWAVPSTILANAMVSDATWRIMFYMAIGYGAFSFIGTFFVYFPPSHPRLDGKTKWQEFKELDFIGLFLFTIGLVLFLVGMGYLGQSTYSTSLVASTTVIGGVLFIGAFIYDFTIPKNPIFPFHLFVCFYEFLSLHPYTPCLYLNYAGASLLLENFFWLRINSNLICHEIQDT